MKGNKNRLHAQLYIRVPSQILNSSHISLHLNSRHAHTYKDTGN